MPSAIEQVYRERRERRFTVLAIDVGESPAKVAAWVEAHRITPPVLLDRDGSVASAYRVSATPTVVLVGRDGKVLARAVGRRPWDGPPGRALLDALLAAP